MSRRIKGVLLGSRIVVFDVNDAKSLYRMGFYGKPLGVSKVKDPEKELNAPLELDLVEATYLVEKGILEVYDAKGKKIGLDELKDIASKRIHEFKELYLVYKMLRDHGYIVRSGLKFGADFAVYEQGPGIDHAPYLVHVIKVHESLTPLEIVRAGRLSHSVRKKFILALVDEKSSSVHFIGFEWYKP